MRERPLRQIIDAFTAAVKADYEIQDPWPHNVSTSGFLEAAEGAEGGLSKYLEYRTRLAKPANVERESQLGQDLFEILASKEGIRKRPGMFFGNDAAAAHIWSAISGCQWAEIDSTGQPGKASAFQIQFQSWVEERFPFSKGLPWHRTFYFVSVRSSEWSSKTFFDHFELFQAGERPDCISQTARIMMQSIADRCGCDPTGMEDAIRKSLQSETNCKIWRWCGGRVTLFLRFALERLTPPSHTFRRLIGRHHDPIPNICFGAGSCAHYLLSLHRLRER